MARPKKQTVDYFPHQCNHGKTMFILEQRYGNDGYAFWFKLLEMLGSTEGHFLDCNNDEQWEFLQSKTRLDSDKCREILTLLSKLEAIDRELWEGSKVVWTSNFIDGVREAYRNRTVEIPDKPSFLRKKSDESENILRQKSANEMKVNEMKVNKTPDRLSEDSFDPFFYKQYPRKVARASALKAWLKVPYSPGLVEKIVSAVEQHKKSEQWKKNNGEFIPHPATWLNQKRWEDELEPAKQGDPGLSSPTRRDPGI